MTLTVLSPVMKCRVVLLTMAILTPAIASAQNLLDTASTPPAARTPQPEGTAASIQPPQVGQIRTAVSLYPLPIVERDTSRTHFQDSVGIQMAGKPRKSVIGWAIAIGIGAGLATSAMAAAKYGENEGGEFCGPCFVAFSAITIPVGAGAGALVGHLIDRSRD
jgi:hypothetical protein